MIRVFLPRVVLELFGSVGACWGVAEAVGLRNQSTVWFWRPASFFVGSLFLIRFCLQIFDHYHVLVSRRFPSTPVLVRQQTEEEGCIEVSITSTHDPLEQV
jgi:hypothetical protein